MKKLFPYALIATFAILSFMPSCKKSDDAANTCTCTFKWITTDTTLKFSPATKAQCDSENTVIKTYFDSTGGCTFN